jgi:hypothetical protein
VVLASIGFDLGTREDRRPFRYAIVAAVLLVALFVAGYKWWARRRRPGNPK